MSFLHKLGLLFLLLLIISNAYAVKVLQYPNPAQWPSCYESYQNAVEPKTFDSVELAMWPICLRHGGIEVGRRLVTTVNERNEVIRSIILTCISKNHTIPIVFSCHYYLNYHDYR